MAAGLAYYDRVGAADADATLHGHDLKLAIAATLGVRLNKFEVSKLIATTTTTRKRLGRGVADAQKASSASAHWFKSDENALTRDEFVTAMSWRLAAECDQRAAGGRGGYDAAA